MKKSLTAVREFIDLNKYGTSRILEMIFFWALAIHLSDRFILIVNWSENAYPVMMDIESGLKIITAGILIFSFLICLRKSYQYAVYHVCAGIVLTAAAYVNKDINYIWILLFVTVSRDVEFSKILKIYAAVRIISLTVLPALLYTGLAQNSVFEEKERIRNSLGLTHPNTVAVYLFTTFFILWYLYLTEKRIVSSILALALALLIWFIIDSRTSSIIMMLFIVLNYIKWDYVFENRIIRFLVQLLPIVCLAVSVAGVILIGDLNYPDIHSSWGTFYSRFLTARNLTKEYGLHLWGSNIPLIGAAVARRFGTTTKVCDLVYLRVIIYNGFATAGIVYYYMLKLTRRILIKKNDKLLILLLLCFMHMFMETNMIRIQYNFLIFACCSNIDKIVSINAGNIQEAKADH